MYYNTVSEINKILPEKVEHTHMIYKIHLYYVLHII